MPQMERFLRQKEVSVRTGLGRSTIYLYIAQGRFPKPVPLGTPHAVGWLSSEIDTWIEEQVLAARLGASRV